MQRIKIAFICVHNSCRSQMAEALGKKYLSDICDCYSAGTETKPQINQDAVRLMKQVYGIDMEATQYSKLFEDIPETDIVISMGCNVVCPFIPGKKNLNWGLEDPTGQSDEKFLEIMRKIEKNILELRDAIIKENACKRSEIAEIIGIQPHLSEEKVEYRVLESVEEDGYTRQLIEYASGEDRVIAYLLLPESLGNNPAILINHQHNREHHLGKSEVCGLAGNPLQAFGPVLAKKGFVVLAPDSICFESRREDPSVEGFDFWQHFHEMCYRILRGEWLMKKVLEDAMKGISLLAGLECVDQKRIGTLGHSYGGNTVLFLSAMDERISFACASGSACTFEYRMKNGVGIEMASVIPGFHGKYDVDDLVACIAPRKLLLVSSEEDKYSMDAPYIVGKAGERYAQLGASQNLHHKRYPGAHALTEERFADILEWVEMHA